MKSKGKRKEIENRVMTKKRKRRVKDTELHVQYVNVGPHIVLPIHSSSYHKIELIQDHSCDLLGHSVLNSNFTSQFPKQASSRHEALIAII